MVMFSTHGVTYRCSSCFFFLIVAALPAVPLAAGLRDSEEEAGLWRGAAQRVQAPFLSLSDH